MRADPLGEPGVALREAAREPRAPVDPERVLARARTLRRRRAAVTVAAAVALLLPLASVALVSPGAIVRFADGGDASGGDGGSEAAIRASIPGTEAPPGELADGTPAGTVPEAVAQRFPGPVVAARRDPDLAGQPPEPCTRTPLSASADSATASVGARLDALGRAAEPVAAHVGPDFATALAVGRSPAPPGYTGLYAAVCIAHHDGEGWRSQGLGVDHLHESWTAWTDSGDGTARVTAFEVPAAAAWAVQEHAGWWLAYDVGGSDWFLAQAAGDDVSRRGRVVFVDAGGGVLADRSAEEGIPPDAPVFRPQVADETVEVGRVHQVRARLAPGAAPLPVCAEDHAVCVWLLDLDGELVALAAAGPHPLDVPPLGAVGYCPAHGTFQGTSTRSVFDPAGDLVDGPAPSGLHRYDVVEHGGRVLVDLTAFTFGPAAAESDGRAGAESDGRGRAPRCDTPEEPGD